ncbi:hypothetical protein ABO01nite_06800 [Asaia bogorensis NBRC 16594]|uniref:Uncharacterized protein n=1 Tax=Asaia bogorensis NBRC 16594 TaxID=1231624 RepID=A0AAN4R1S3_9PROT|nr:hypothetical protein ABO01nite_06800 [Asaia bogorensis NBRC 16594]
MTGATRNGYLEAGDSLSQIASLHEQCAAEFEQTAIVRRGPACCFNEHQEITASVQCLGQP